MYWCTTSQRWFTCVRLSDPHLSPSDSGQAEEAPLSARPDWHRRTPARIEVEQTPVRPQTPPRKSRARCNDATYRFECGEQPPPRGRGSTDRAVRQRATHRSNVRWSTSNSAASCAYEPAPRSYAITARYPQRHVIRIRHGVIQVHSPRQCKWEAGLSFRPGKVISLFLWRLFPPYFRPLVRTSSKFGRRAHENSEDNSHRPIGCGHFLRRPSCRPDLGVPPSAGGGGRGDPAVSRTSTAARALQGS